jgi:hypothetical protein
MDVLAAYRDVGTYRGAAVVCGTTHKTVKKIIEAHEAGERPQRKPRGRNFDQVADLVAERVAKSAGSDFGEAVVAGGAGGRLCGVGAELPPAGGAGEGGVAS